MDPTRPTDTEGGILTSNYITREAHTVSSVNSKPYRILIPTYAPFYLRDLKLVHKAQDGTERELVERVDFNVVLRYMDADRKTSYPTYAGLEILEDHLSGTFYVDYRMLGDDWVPDRDYVYNRMLETIFNPRVVWWDQITNVQQLFPVTDHPTAAEEIQGHQAILEALQKIEQAVLTAAGQFPATTIAHTLLKGNPHETTKEDLGLGLVRNLKTATDAEVLLAEPERDTNGIEVEKYITHRQVRLLFTKLIQELT